MTIVTRCTAPGCDTLTIGPLCAVHDLPVERVFVRGRPFPDAVPAREWRPAVVTATTSTTSLRTASVRGAAAPVLR